MDNLTPDFLDPILGEVQLELMQAIWRHIRPLPYPHGPQAARILGKLAGRNRRFLQHPQAIKSVRIRCPVDVVVAAAAAAAAAEKVVVVVVVITTHQPYLRLL